MEKTQPATSIQSPQRGRRRGRVKRLLIWAGGVLLVLLVIGELLTRFWLGLGDPVLYDADREMQYVQKPSRSYQRFGHTISINSYGMRGGEFPPHKSDPMELRVLVVGDSVINGGSQIDQTEVCTAIAQHELAFELARPVVVANTSAGGWHLTNMAAYLRRFGTFDADVMVLVLAGHDYAHLERPYPYPGIDPDFPASRPWLALEELFQRYGMRYAKYYLGMKKDIVSTLAAPTSQADIDRGIAALGEIITTAQSRGIRLVLLQHLQTTEYNHPETQGHAMIRRTAESMGVPVVQLAPAFEVAGRAGARPYRDTIHLNASGHQVVAREIIRQVEQLVGRTPIKG